MSGKRMGRTLVIAAVVAIVVVVVVVVGTAGGRKSSSITLKSRNASGVGNVLAAPNARTLYRLSPETKSHVLCTSSTCLGIWKPLTVKSKSTTVKLPSGVSSRVSFLKRGTRFQVVLSNHPLYTFVSDTAAGQANGQRIKSFGGTWFVIAVKAKKNSAPAPTQTQTQTTQSNPYGGYGGY